MSTAANAFVEFRRNCTAIHKQAADAGGGSDWGSTLGGFVGSAGKYISENPWALGALGGGLVGGVSGLFSDQPGSVLRNALIGAGVGGLGGYGYSKLPEWLKAYQAAQREQQKRDEWQAMTDDTISGMYNPHKGLPPYNPSPRQFWNDIAKDPYGRNS